MFAADAIRCMRRGNDGGGGSGGGTRSMCVCAATSTSHVIATSGNLISFGYYVAPITGPFVHISATCESQAYQTRLLIREDGSLYCEGNIQYGVVSGTPTSGAYIAASAGQYHAGAIDSNGDLVLWGMDISGSINDKPVDLGECVDVACAYRQTVVCLADGSVRAWGNNGKGQTNVPAGISNAVHISSMGQTVAAVESTGLLHVWGDNAAGLVTSMNGLENVKQVSIGVNNGAVVFNDGTLGVYGSDTHGQITNKYTGSDCALVSAGSSNILLALTDGSVLAWGQDTYGKSTVPAGTYTNPLW